MVIYQTSAQADKTARARSFAAQTALALIAAAAVCMTAACTIEGESDDDGRSPRPGVPVYTYNALFNAADGRFPDPDGSGPLESITGTAKTGQKISSLGAERGGWSFSAWTSPTKDDETAVFKDGEVFTKSALDSLRPDDEGVITFTAVWNPEDTSIEIVNPDQPWNGGFQEVTINETGTYRIELWGAQGGFANDSKVGGAGGYTKGDIELEAGTTLYFYIGGARIPGKPNSKDGAYNGGGSGMTNIAVGAGGGATDVRTVRADTPEPSNHLVSVASRIMVAAGGGGANSKSTGGGDGLANHGGYAGGTTGGQGNGQYKPTGGTPISGGNPGNAEAINCGGTAGSFGKGGSVSVQYNDQSAGGGGGGWFGGASGNHWGTNSSGAGGSSYISGHSGCVGTSSPNGFTQNPASDGVEKSKSYTGLFFTNTEIKAGNQAMPRPDGLGTEPSGHIGPGAAKITKLAQ